MKWLHGLEALTSDIRYGYRRLRRRPALSGLAVALFGLGIGLNVAWFSLADAVLLGPLPFRESDRLYSLWPARMFNKEMVDRAGSDLASWRGVAGYTQWAYPVSHEGSATEQVATAQVSTNFFEVLGIAPWRGEGFRPGDALPGSDALIVSHEYWQNRLGGDDGVLGRRLTVDGRDRRIVGILPPGPRLLGRVNDLWLPYAVDRSGSDFRASFYLRTVGRLAEGASAESAAQELAAFSARMQAENPIYTPDDFVWPPTVESWRSQLFGGSAELVETLAFASAAVLLLVCANVSHLLLVNAEARQGEFALLVALGAGRARIVRSILVETLLLAVAGAAAGCLVLVWTRGLLLRWLPDDRRATPMSVSAAVRSRCRWAWYSWSARWRRCCRRAVP